LSVGGANITGMADPIAPRDLDADAAEDPCWQLVDALAGVVDADDGEVRVHLAAMNARGSAEGQRRVVAALWRCEHARLVAVLELLAGHHPEPEVAREARKSVFRARSRLAGV
jgi:hypothetical protein